MVKNMMSQSNDRREREREADQHINENESGGLGFTKRQGSTARNEPNQVGDYDRERRSPSRRIQNSSRGTVAGGILRQLKQKNRKSRTYHQSQLAYHESQSEYHREQIEEADDEYRDLEQLEAELRDKESKPFPTAADTDGENHSGEEMLAPVDNIDQPLSIDIEKLPGIEAVNPGADEEEGGEDE